MDRGSMSSWGNGAQRKTRWRATSSPRPVSSFGRFGAFVLLIKNGWSGVRLVVFADTANQIRSRLEAHPNSIVAWQTRSLWSLAGKPRVFITSSHIKPQVDHAEGSSVFISCRLTVIILSFLTNEWRVAARTSPELQTIQPK